MKRNMKITAFLMTVLVLSCMTAGCAQPLLRSANTETAQQTTYADAMDSSPDSACPIANNGSHRRRKY